MVTTRLSGSTELWLAKTFLPLLLLTWLPIGLSSTTREVKWFNVTCNDGKQQNGGSVEKKNDLAQVIFANVNKVNAGTYTCRVKNRTSALAPVLWELSKGGKGQKSSNAPRSGKKGLKRGERGRTQLRTCEATSAQRVILKYSRTASQVVKPVTTEQSKTCSKNLTAQMKCYKLKCLEGENQTSTVVLGEICMNFTNSSWCPGICMYRFFITRPNSTGTGNSTLAEVLSCGCAGPQTDVTWKIWTGLNLLCILLGLAVGTLFYMPVIGFLLWQCRRNRTGELMSGDLAEGNQAAPVTGTEDLTYANLNFEKKGTGSASSNVIYTEIKPSQ